MELIGCTRQTLAEHLRGNLSLNDIDHIFPFVLFDLDSHGDQQKVMHWSNLQLLTPEENKSKNDKLPTKAMAAKVDPSCWPDGVTMDDLPDIYPGWATPLRMLA